MSRTALYSFMKTRGITPGLSVYFNTNGVGTVGSASSPTGPVWHAWRYPHDPNPTIESLPPISLDGARLRAALDAAFDRGRSGKP